MKFAMGDSWRRKVCAAVMLAVLGCAAAVWMSKTAWIGVAFSLLGAAALMLRGRSAAIAEAVVLIVFALTDSLTGGKGFSAAFLALGAGILAAHFAIEALCRRMLSVEKDLEMERQRGAATSMVSVVGQARNLRAYQNDAAIYIKLTKRYHLHLYLISWKLKNAAELRKQMSEAQYAHLSEKISETMSRNMRAEDMIYMLDEGTDSLQWGSLHITNEADVQPIIEKRILNALAPMAKKMGVEVQFQITDAKACEGMTPMMLLEALPDQNEQ